MYFKLYSSQETEFLNRPETGMGYQVVEAIRTGNYTTEKFLVLNSEVVIEIDNYLGYNVKKVINAGMHSFRKDADYITLRIMSILDEHQYRNLVNEPISKNEPGAIENPVENADGKEIFVRLSAFNIDRRIDKVKMCLLPGSYTTTMTDYLSCKITKNDPVERYALPNNDEVKHAFHIQPIKTDSLQRGIVQPANGKSGGGKEVFFASGTALGTFIKQTLY